MHQDFQARDSTFFIILVEVINSLKGSCLTPKKLNYVPRGINESWSTGAYLLGRNVSVWNSDAPLMYKRSWVTSASNGPIQCLVHICSCSGCWFSVSVTFFSLLIASLHNHLSLYYIHYLPARIVSCVKSSPSSGWLVNNYSNSAIQSHFTLRKNCVQILGSHPRPFA